MEFVYLLLLPKMSQRLKIIPPSPFQIVYLTQLVEQDISTTASSIWISLLTRCLAHANGLSSHSLDMYSMRLKISTRYLFRLEYLLGWHDEMTMCSKKIIVKRWILWLAKRISLQQPNLCPYLHLYFVVKSRCTLYYFKVGMQQSIHRLQPHCHRRKEGK